MKKWILKAIVQKTISFLPYKHRINYLFQKYVTRGVDLSDDYFLDRLNHFQNHRAFQVRYKKEVEGIKVLELGTGWYPVIPIGFFLSGADQIYTVDISELTNKEKILETVDRFLKHHQAGLLTQIEGIQTDRLEKLQEIAQNRTNLSFTDLLQQLHIQYLVADARKLPIPSDSIDLATSNNTFEHVYPDILADILKEFVRVVKPDGLMSHFIDMSDHFAHLDQQISIYNFLQFSDQQWQWIDNTIQPQNRWRITQYRDLYQQLGIPISEEQNRKGNPEVVKSMSLAAPFSEISPEEVAISHSYVVSSL